ncbi:MAG: elongation factor G [Planctomycetia bacterium]|nr:MAG: elongation factor G [Planctomycetia bacterium]
MAVIKPEAIRNVALCGHGSTGKTTLIDKILMATGAVSGDHSVDDGTSVGDFDEEEKRHKYSVEASITHFRHDGKEFHLADTPGYPDFIGQTIGALRGFDTAAIVINAHTGIEVNTRRVFAEAGKFAMGRIIVLNKMDTDNVDYPAVIDSIKELWGSACVPLNVPVGHGADFRGVVNTLKVPADTAGALLDPAAVGESLLESIIEVDEEVTERYFDGQNPTDEEIATLLVRAIQDGSLIPIVAVSAKTGVGLPELLDALAMCAVPASQVERTGTKADQEVQVSADPEGPLVAQVFKTRIDPFVQKLSFVRIYSGTLKKDVAVTASTSRKGVKIGPLLAVQGGETSPVDGVGPGGIVAIAKMEDLHTGTSLGDVLLPGIDFPAPMVGLAVSPKSRGDDAKLSGSLQKIVEEDPTFRITRDAQTKEMVMTGMSELHLMILQERLARRDKVEVETKEPKIPYRETIQANAEGSYRHKKQSGGRGQFGEVHIRVWPLPKETNIEEFAVKDRFASMKEPHYDPDHNFLWIDSVVGGTIPSNFLPAVEKGFRDRMGRGVIAGYQVQDLCVEVHFGKHHPVDSSEAAFKTAASMALRNVFQEARPCLLEPVVKMAITVPGDKVGDVNSDMSGRRGRVLGMESAGGDLQTVEVEAPLAEVSTYARTLSSMTGGQGSYTMEFSHYDVVPPNVQKEIVDKAAVKKKEEDED